jgi:hypothetical protein
MHIIKFGCLPVTDLIYPYEQEKINAEKVLCVNNQLFFLAFP